MRPNRHRRRESQLGLFQPPAQATSWGDLLEQSKRRLRRLLSRMIREAAERIDAGRRKEGADDE